MPPLFSTTYFAVHETLYVSLIMKVMHPVPGKQVLDGLIMSGT